MATVQALLREADDLPGEDARRDAEVLLGHCLKRARSWLYAFPEFDVSVEQTNLYRDLLARRRDGEPIAYIVGEREFWSLVLAITPTTLVPRPETETLVEWALQLQPQLAETAAVLDAGCGSGAIALALAAEQPDWQVTGVDCDPASVALAAANAERLGLHRVVFLESDWFCALDGRSYDLILANPPYLAESDPHLERGDLRREPRRALVAGPSGLEDLAALIRAAPGQLQSNGWLLLEHGWEQGAAVRELLVEAGFSAVQTRNDLAGHERASGGCLRVD